MFVFEVCQGPMCGSMNGPDLLSFLKSHPLAGSTFVARECDCTGNCSNASNVFIDGDLFNEVTIEILSEEIENL